MSDQDEIAKLLAEANAEAADASPSTEAVDPSSPAPAPTPRKQPHRIGGQTNTDVLGVAWFNGVLHAASFRRQKMTQSWSCETSVRTVAEFEAVIDEMLAKLEFGGTEMFILLENELFQHQTEGIPSFSEAAGRSYLKGRIQRYQQENGPVLWVSQPTIVVKQEQAILLHLLPTSFYDQLNRVLLLRHLDLTRILPLVVPLQYELNKIPAGKDTPVIVVAESGSSTSVVVGRIGGPLLFARTILAELSREPSRVGVEVNRSLLFAKQHHDCAVDRIWLMAQSGQVSPELNAKCGSSRKIVVLPTTPIDWLQTTIKLSSQQPVNLLASYLKRKQQHRLIRLSLLALGWFGLVLMILNFLSQANDWKNESARMAELRGREPALNTERDQILKRNATIDRQQAFIKQIETDRLPSVPTSLIGYVASILPSSARLTDFSVKRETETGGWTFRVDGMIESDDETARDLIKNMQHQLEKSPFRARFTDSARVLNAAPVSSFTTSESQRFTMEGVVLEK